MTSGSTDLHPSHEWIEEWENDFRYFLCVACLICSCCYVGKKFKTCDRGWVTDGED